MLPLLPGMLNLFGASKSVMPRPSGSEKIEDASGEAAQNYIGKASKIDVATEAVYLQDLQALALQDRLDVQRLKEKYVWKGQPSPLVQSPQSGGPANSVIAAVKGIINPQAAAQQGGDPLPGDIIVCDEFNVNSQPPAQPPAPAKQMSPLLASVLTAGGLLAAGAGGYFLNRPSVPVVPSATSPIGPPVVQLDSEWDVVNYIPAVKDADGKIIQPEKIVSRVHHRSRNGIVEQLMPDGTWVPVRK